jgi:hypothetical protein
MERRHHASRAVVTFCHTAANRRHRSEQFLRGRVQDLSATLEDNQRADFALAMLALTFGGPRSSKIGFFLP